MSKLVLGLGWLLLAVLAAQDRGFAQVKAIASGAPPPAELPLSLTASDGTGLELTSLSARVVVEDPLAFTELQLAFRNPEPRVREGRFRITLPPGAVISRFAMKIDGRWQEGEVVELQAARQAYEDFLHRRQDPALLETEAGNEFSARVFPIPAGASKELIVSYSQELTPSGAGYRLPLKGLPRLGTLDIRALVSRAEGGSSGSSLGGQRSRQEVVEVKRQAFRPDRDFEVSLAASGRMGLRHDNLVVARVRALEEKLPADPVRGLLVLFDSSASRAPGFDDQVGRLAALVGALRTSSGGDAPLALAAFDQHVELVWSGAARDFGPAVAERLRQRRALGASDLGKALGWAQAFAAGRSANRLSRVLLVTDGVATAGPLTNGSLRGLVKALGPAGIERLDVLAVGGIRDDERLAALAAAGLARAGVVLAAATPAPEQARRLNLATRSGLPVAVEGAVWVWPQRLDGVQPGDEVLVYADLPAERSLRISIGGRAIASSGGLASAPGPLLERAWVKARLARLMAQRDAATSSDPDLAEALRQQATALSIKHRVLCPFTALLVLETEHDYQRFGIDRRALADILAVGPTGIDVLERRDAPLIAGPTVAAAPPADPTPSLAPMPAPPKPERRRPAPEPSAAPPIAAPPVASAPVAPASAPPSERPSAAPRFERDAIEGLLKRGEAAGVARAIEEEDADDRPARARRRAAPGAVAPAAKGPASSPHEGRFAEVLALLARGHKREALARALAWREAEPGDVLALVALGEAAEASGDRTLAARAYGSIIDLFPGRADLRRLAGNRLERLRGGDALALAIDSYKQAVEQRPDHPAAHRLLAFALVKAGRPADAFARLVAGIQRRYPDGRFAGVGRILAEDLGLVAAVWSRAEPARAADIRERLRRAGGREETGASLRFVLTWETDANDVDFHIRDGRGGHAYYSQRHLPSGGELYADVTTGYGPECFTVRAPVGGRAYPYRLKAHYYSRGPMGYGMGKLQIVEHDGRGQLRFEERPFVVMRDGAYIELGSVQAPGGVTSVLERARTVLMPIMRR